MNSNNVSVYEFSCKIDIMKETAMYIISSKLLNAQNSLEFENSIIKIAEFHNIMIDMKDVEIITSMAIGGLLNIYKKTQFHNRKLQLINVNPVILKIFDHFDIISGLIKID